MREVSEKDEFIALLDFRKRRFDELSAQPRSVKSPNCTAWRSGESPSHGFSSRTE